LQAGDLAGWAESGAGTYAFGPRISWAALDLGRVRAQIKAANARADAQLAYYEKTVLTALEETENALVSLGREQARGAYLRASTQAAQQAVNLARERFQGGLSDYLPVLDAERTLLTVENQLAQSETRAATTLVAVYKALGGGWQLQPPPATTSAKR
jgi:multidrug efflux system outer membrane protein